MLDSVATPDDCFRKGDRYEVDMAHGVSFIRSGAAIQTTQPPEIIERLLARLEIGAGGKAIFLPNAGIEFGHTVMTGIRIVEFSRATEKIVCCRPGEQVLYPSATGFCTDWTDPIPDAKRVGTMRDTQLLWPEIAARYPE
jgi:hypothetical protein